MTNDELDQARARRGVRAIKGRRPVYRHRRTVEQLQAQIASLTAEIESLRSALKPRVSNVNEDQVAAGWAAWDDCRDAEQADNPMRAALEASHLIFVRRALQIAENARAALQPKEGEA